MGSGIAANYVKAGYEVIVWNRSPEKTDALQQAGATLASSPRAATEQAEIIFEVTANDGSSQTVWQGKQGILAGAASDKILIASATLSTDWTGRLNQLCAALGFTFLDIPLTGGRVAAENGTLTLLVGGDEGHFEALKPDLSPISSKTYYFGSTGSGMKYKLILNSLQAAHIAAFGEAMKLATAQGLDPTKVGSALCDRPGGIITQLAWTAYQQAHPPLTFSVDWITKDLEYARQLAGHQALPILDEVLASYQKAQAAGAGDQDWASVIKPA